MDTAVGQPALCAVQIALAGLWRSWGVEPAAVAGHSVGEIAAAQVAGALTQRDALLIALHRGMALHAATGKGRMAVVGVPVDRARQILEERGATVVWVAASNSPNTTVFSGEAAPLRRLAEELEAEGVYCRVLESVEFASHSPLMEPVAAELARKLTGLRPAATSVPMISTVTGEPIDGDRLDAGYWADNLTQPVLFDTAVTVLADLEHDVFVEISPHPMLGDAISERLTAQSDDEGVVVASLRRDEQGRNTVLGELGKLYSAGFPVDWRTVYGTTGPMVDLPAYPWQRERCWLEDKPARRRGSSGGHPVLESYVDSAVAPRARHWVAPVDLAGFGYLRDHQVGGNAVLPASLMLDAALTAAHGVLGNAGVTLDDVRFTRMTVVPEAAEDPTLQLVFVPETASGGAFRFFSRPDGASPWAEIATGRYRGAATPGDDAHEALAAVLGRCTRDTPVQGHYDAMASAGLGYGPAFQGIAELRRGEREAVGRLRDRKELTREPGAHLVHPCVLDSCMQVLAGGPRRRTLRHPPAGARRRVPHGRGRRPALGARRARRRRRGERRRDRALRRGRHRHGRADRPGPRTPRPGRHRRTRRPALRGGLDRGGGHRARRTRRGLVADPRRPRTGLRRTAHRLAAAGGACVMVTPGDGVQRLSRTRYEIDPTRREDVAELLGTLRADGLAPVRVVYGWGLDAELPADGEDPAGITGVCVPALHLVQELVRDSEAHENAEPPQLVLLTRGAQHTAGQDGVAAAQAPLWGLGRVLPLEHGELRPKTVDLDPAGAGRRGRRAPRRTAAPGDDDQVALRDGKRLTPVLRTLAGTGTVASWPRRPADTERRRATTGCSPSAPAAWTASHPRGPGAARPAAARWRSRSRPPASTSATSSRPWAPTRAPRAPSRSAPSAPAGSAPRRRGGGPHRRGPGDRGRPEQHGPLHHDARATHVARRPRPSAPRRRPPRRSPTSPRSTAWNTSAGSARARRS